MRNAAGNKADDRRASDVALDALVDALELELHLCGARVVKIMRAQKIRLYEGCADAARDDAVR